ncbi:LytTR family DNA-binding domain-containing protein [Oscillibacter valericigenes]|uniref:LytTR family DNA-binding domain-containing protein n=1 Tax=Oscillibacter valericigenes TaxID=351091 RepID=UPI0038B36D6E
MPVKIELHIDPSLSGTEVTVRAPARTPEVDALLDRLAAGATPLLGFCPNGTAVPLDLDAVLRFYGEDKDVRAQTPEAVYTVRERLYELEQQLEGRRFVRISHSEIVNLRKVTALDLSLTGTIRMTLSGSVAVYVSRRYVKKMKEVLGL